VDAPLPGHSLPRYSSRDFVDAEIGGSLLDVVLEPGDLLYLPRGTIHQAESLPDGSSLHLTVSADHQRSWADLLEASLQGRPSSHLPPGPRLQLLARDHLACVYSFQGCNARRCTCMSAATTRLCARPSRGRVFTLAGDLLRHCGPQSRQRGG